MRIAMVSQVILAGAHPQGGGTGKALAVRRHIKTITYDMRSVIITYV